jgi:hypothetical protein
VKAQPPAPRTNRRRFAVLSVAVGVGVVAGGAIGFLAQGQPSRPEASLLTGAPPSHPAAPSSPSPTRLIPVIPDTMLAWTPGGIPPGLGRSVRRIPGIDHVVTVTSGTAWLIGSFDASGALVDHPPPGLAIPLEMAGADLSSYSPFLSPADRAVLPPLARGQAVLGATSARLRRLGPGATLSFGSRKLRVAAVLPDAAIGAHEVFVSRATAAALGVAHERYLLIDPSPDASRAAVVARIRALLPDGTQVRIRGPGETPFFRQGDAVLPPVKIKEVFGEFAARPISGGFLRIDPGWEKRHIVNVTVPILGMVRCNRALIPQLRQALGEIVTRGLSHLIHPGDYGGCYAPRFINRNPLAGISHHAWGVAVDVNVSSNRFGQSPHQDPRVVAVFERWGFTWGGSWLRPDGMHFEFVRFPTAD